MKYFSKLYSWLKSYFQPVKEPEFVEYHKPKTPIIEYYRFRPCPERERFNESLHSTGFVAQDGILRVFYDSRDFAVELEVNGLTIDLRELSFPYHPRWGLSKDLIHTWMKNHDLGLSKDYGWAGDIWS